MDNPTPDQLAPDDGDSQAKHVVLEALDAARQNESRSITPDEVIQIITRALQ